MRTTWVVGLCMLFFFGTMISMTLENEYIGSEVQYEDKAGNPCEASDPGATPVGTVSKLFVLMRTPFSSFSNPLTAIGGFFILVWNWIQALWGVLWWQYSFFTGYWKVLQYLGWCLSIGIVVSIILAVRGVGSS